ncbi:hypothetical protein QTP88_019913 [Uroleucon formosanum]
MDQCHQSFWRRWSSEYLTTLQERSRWTKGVPNVKIDDMVVVVDNQNPPLLWRLGRIVELFPGTDGHVRVARVLTRAGSVKEPIKIKKEKFDDVQQLATKYVPKEHQWFYLNLKTKDKTTTAIDSDND